LDPVSSVPFGCIQLFIACFITSSTLPVFPASTVIFQSYSHAEFFVFISDDGVFNGFAHAFSRRFCLPKARSGMQTKNSSPPNLAAQSLPLFTQPDSVSATFFRV
jgi:hypothetical protein